MRALQEGKLGLGRGEGVDGKSVPRRERHGDVCFGVEVVASRWT